MKNIFSMLLMVLMVNANATTEDKNYVHPSNAEITKNRACFKQLEERGCGNPKDDPEHFRSCMSSLYSALDDHCQRTLINLYGSDKD